jgi:hypothetical protein
VTTEIWAVAVFKIRWRDLERAGEALAFLDSRP